MLSLSSGIGAAILVLLVVLLFSAIWIFREYERGIVFTLGRFSGRWPAPAS